MLHIEAFNRLLDLSDEDYEKMFELDDYFTDHPDASFLLTVTRIMGEPIPLHRTVDMLEECKNGGCDIQTLDLFSPGPGTYKDSSFRYSDLEQDLDYISERNKRTWKDVHGH